MPPIVVDTGPLYAMADRDDDWHGRVVAFLKRSRDELIVPVAVLPEAAYLLATHLGPDAERKLIRSLIAGEMTVADLTLQDLRRAHELLTRYEATKLGLVDATVVATAERLKITRVLTTDRRDFSLIRPHHCKALELLP
jgi:predicted nucleic acid-binding protein